MRMADLGLFDECFTHLGDDGHQTTWAAAALNAFCETNPDKVERGSVPVDRDHAEFCVTNRGVEQDRLDALMARPEALTKPILFVQMPDDSHLLVDGTHRYVCYYALKVEKITCYMVSFAVAKAFIIEDAPQTTEEQVMAPSHLTALRKLGFGL